ncbi:MAG: RNA methyltransferase [Bacteroidetes bacterium]|nr:RNA methyltransferase [Bacteroidota bacterium]
MNPEKITSLQNDKVKNLVRLQKSAERKKQNLILIEGWREINQAIGKEFQIEAFYLHEDKNNESSKLSGKVFLLAPHVFEKVAYRENTEGVIAVAKPKYHSFETLKLRENPLLIVLESVEKPGNLGAVLRTAEAAAVDAVIVCDPLTDIYNPNVIRSSLGCVFSVPVVACSNKDAIQYLKEKTIKSYAAELKASKRYDLPDYTRPAAIVLGTEATGLTDEWISAADERIIIPMLGEHDSLNVSVSAAILVFEALRQRGFKVQ